MAATENEQIPAEYHGKIPMHPEDFAGLLAWVRAKEYQERMHG